MFFTVLFLALGVWIFDLITGTLDYYIFIIYAFMSVYLGIFYFARYTTSRSEKAIYNKFTNMVEDLSDRADYLEARRQGRNRARAESMSEMIGRRRLSEGKRYER